MKQVKIFSESSYMELEDRINNWLSTNNYFEIVDIKFAIDDCGYYVIILYRPIGEHRGASEV